MSLNIVISADPQAAVAGLKKVEAQLEQTGASARRVIPQVSALGKTLDDLNQKIRGKTALLSTETDVTKIKILRAEILLLQREAARVGNIGKIGFDQLGNAIQKTQTPITAVGVGLTKSLGLLRNIAYVLPGIGIAGILGGLSSLVISLFEGGKASKFLQEQLQKLSEGVAEQAVKLTSLVGIVGNVNASYKDKDNALKAINQEYKSYIANLGIEQVTAENIAVAYNKIIDSLLRQAVVKGLQEQITAEVEKTAKVVLQFQLAEEKRKQASEKATDQAKSQLTVDQQVAKAMERKNAVVRDGFIAQTQANASIDAAFKKEATFENQLAKVRQELIDSLKPLLALTTSFDDLGIALDKPKVLKIEQAFKLIKIPDFSDIEIGVKFSTIALDETKLTEGLFKEPVTVPIEFRFDKLDPIAAKKLEDQTKAAIDNINNIIQSLAVDELANVGELIGEAFAGGDINKAFQAFASTLGTAIQAIGKQLIAIGVAAALANEALKTLFTGPGGALLAIGAGIALVAAGAALKTALTKGIPGRATGGPVGAGMPYWVGEGGKKEMFIPSTSGKIVPSNSLGGIAGSAIKNIHITGSIKGQGRDLVLVFNREMNFQNSVT